MVIKMNKLVREISTELKKSGILIKEQTVEKVLDQYVLSKVSALLRGETVVEHGLMSISPKTRLSNSFDGRNILTVKLDCKLDPDLKSDMLKEIVQNESYRAKLLNGKELDEDSLEYLKSKYGDLNGDTK